MFRTFFDGGREARKSGCKRDYPLNLDNPSISEYAWKEWLAGWDYENDKIRRVVWGMLPRN